MAEDEPENEMMTDDNEDDDVQNVEFDKDVFFVKAQPDSFTVTLNTEAIQQQAEQEPLAMLMASATLLIAGFLILCALMAFAWYCCGVKKDNAGKKNPKKKVDDPK